MLLNMTTEKFTYKEKLRNTQKHKDIKNIQTLVSNSMQMPFYSSFVKA